MFELLSPTKCKLNDVGVLSKKNRPPDEDPGVQIKVEFMLPNSVLSEVDGHLRSFLFERASGAGPRQKALDGVEIVSDMPALSEIGSKVGSVKWGGTYTGYDVEIDFGLGGKRNLSLGDSTIDRIRFYPKQGGTVLTKCVLESREYPDGTFDRLAKMKSREILVLLRGPQVQQGDLVDQPPAKTPNRGKDAENWPFKKDQPQGVVPEADPTTTFVETHSGKPPAKSVKPRGVRI